MNCCKKLTSLLTLIFLISTMIRTKKSPPFLVHYLVFTKYHFHNENEETQCAEERQGLSFGRKNLEYLNEKINMKEG